MFEAITNFLKKLGKPKNEASANSKNVAKERLHLVLMQDRANVSADFLDLMKQEIIEVIKKYIDVDENAIDVRLTNKTNDDGTTGAPALYANIPIVSIKEEAKNENKQVENKKEEKDEQKKEDKIKEEKVVKNDKKETEKVAKEEVKEENKEKKEESEEKPEVKENV